MVKLSRWRFDGTILSGFVEGHNRLADGAYIYTSKVLKFELLEESLDAYTHSGTHYRMYVDEIDIDCLNETKKELELKNVDTVFVKNAVEKVEELQKQKAEEVDKLLEENDLYLEFIGLNMKYGFFKRDGVIHKLDCQCHVGTFQDSYLIIKPGIVDVRYFDRWSGIDFYHVSDGINNIHFKYAGDMIFDVTGIGEGLHFTSEDTEIKTIKAEKCTEGLFSPDCVNGKSALFIPDDTEENAMLTMEEVNDLLGGFDPSKTFAISWKSMSELTKTSFKMLLESGAKVKVTIKEGDLGCEEVQEYCSINDYLVLYKSGNDYILDFEEDFGMESETVLCTDDFEYICSIVEKYRRYLE